jgi:hypothetical protein
VEACPLLAAQTGFAAWPYIASSCYSSTGFALLLVILKYSLANFANKLEQEMGWQMSMLQWLLIGSW